jgi:hypothetical protein
MAGTPGLLLAFLAAGCNESLPPVEQPEDVQVVDVSFVGSGDGLVALDSHLDPKGNPGALRVTVTNLFREYMADDEQIEVEIRMYMKNHPERRTVITMSREDLWTSGVLAHGVLMIAPRQTVRIEKQWAHRTDQGESYLTWAALDSIAPVVVMSSTGRSYLAYPVHLMAQADIKVFKNRPTEYVPADRRRYKELVLYYFVD